MKIGDIEFKNNILLAPMAGVTDVAFRSICINYGADAGVTEMVSAKALLFDNEKTKDLLLTAPNEKIKIVQIFGHEPLVMAQICASKELEKFDIIDINMGCPAPKIVTNGEGSALMKDIKLASEIISACVKATTKPITVKFRSGYDKSNINAIEFAKMCEKAGAKAITIHARTRDQMYSGKVDLEVVKKIKENVKIPVIASGDIVDKISYINTINYTKCDGVMIGRGALGNPAIFADILECVDNKNKNLLEKEFCKMHQILIGPDIEGKKTFFNKFDIIKKHIEMLRDYYPDRFIAGHIRKHLLWYLKGEKDASKLKVFVSTEPSLDNVLVKLEEFFKNK